MEMAHVTHVDDSIKPQVHTTGNGIEYRFRFAEGLRVQEWGNVEGFRAVARLVG